MTRHIAVRAVTLGIFVFIAGAGLVLAQETDAEGCKDHPMLSRMKDFYLESCDKNFDAQEFILKDGATKSLEGDKYYLRYQLRENAARPSPLQIRRNYENAIKGIGGEVIYSAEEQATFRVIKSGKETWVRLDVWNAGSLYDLTILEITAMQQEVTADAMYEALSKDGFIALYINFDTGKSEIKPEAQGTIDQIAALLTGHADLKIGIEGHTDNVGTPAANKTLSEQRAKAVMAAVAAKGVAAARMIAVGWGQEKPVADNRSEDGRAKNRRVEIVKK